MLNALLPQVNVDPEDLIPKLPRPRDLQPFPVCQALVSVGSEVGKCPQASVCLTYHSSSSVGLQGPQRPCPLPQCLPRGPVASFR